MKKIMSLVIVLSMLLAPLAFAASPWVDGKTYGEKVSGKLGYGLTNTVLRHHGSWCRSVGHLPDPGGH